MSEKELPRSEWPDWLQNAQMEKAIVIGPKEWPIVKGNWLGGDFQGGDFRGRNFLGGDFLGGNFLGGDFRGGNFLGGTWQKGNWKHNVIKNRLLFHASMIGIVFDRDGYATAYRSTNANASGRYIADFIQEAGKQEYHHDPSGSGTCCRGIHVSTAAIAMTYFKTDPTALLWKVKFHRDQLLDCDGQKARISGGFFEQIPWFF